MKIWVQSFPKKGTARAEVLRRAQAQHILETERQLVGMQHTKTRE